MINAFTEPYARRIFTNYISREDVDFAYVPIYRSGHNWVAAYLKENGFQSVVKASVHNKRKLVILREPLERIVSGMAISNFDYNKLFKNKIDLIETLKVDPHTNQQVYFLNKIDESYDFIKLGPNLPDNLKKYLSDRGIEMPNECSMSWSETGSSTRLTGINDKEVVEFIRSNTKLSEKFQKYLKDDYTLYNMVKWYGTN